MISEKALCSKGFSTNLRDILRANNRKYNSYRFDLVINLLLSLFCPFPNPQLNRLSKGIL